MKSELQEQDISLRMILNSKCVPTLETMEKITTFHKATFYKEDFNLPTVYVGNTMTLWEIFWENLLILQEV